MTRPRSKPVRLDDIAKKLNISKVAVSKALRDHADISIETKNKVKELAEKLGYIPNILAKNLSSKRSNAIGLIIPEIAHFFFGSLIESVYDAALEFDYETVLKVSHESAEREQQNIHSLISMKVDGIIISITQESKDLKVFKDILKRNIPVVFIDRVPKIQNASCITVDDKGGAYSSVEQFYNSGIMEIAHIGGFSHINIGKERLDGFTEAMENFNIPINKDWIVEGGFEEDDGYNGFKRIHKSGKLPKAILAVSHPVGIGIYLAAKEVGIKIPDDIQVTCFGNNTYHHYIPSIFNFVHQPSTELGREAVKLLMLKIADPKLYKATSIEFKTELLVNS